MFLRLPMTMKDYNRMVEREKKDPKMLGPFSFHIEGVENTVFILNHGMESGGLFNFRTGKGMKVKEFLEEFGFLRRFPDEEICIFCCYGRFVENDMPERVKILNNTKNVMHHEVARMLMDYDPKMGIDFWWEDE